jgi:hypothetical protein
MHEKSKGDIIVYMDDDDYYHEERVSHAVDMLKSNKKALCAGSSEIYIYFNDLKLIYKFGPYGPNHATAGTFAFKRELLNITSYNEEACLAEEKHFLKDYTIPFVQLNPLKTILVFSHSQNTFDKKKLLVNAPNDYVKVSDKTLKTFIKNDDIITFYSETIHKLIKDYKEGDIEMKPDVIKQTKEIQEKRDKLEKKINEDRLRQEKERIDNISFNLFDKASGKTNKVSINDIINNLNVLINENNNLKVTISELQNTIIKLQN